MSERSGRPISRRGLLGIFGASAKSFGDTLKQEAPALGPRKAQPSFERKLRPAEDLLMVTSDGQGGFLVDLRARPIPVGHSAKLLGAGLAEPLLAARVNETHVAIVAGECPVDGSDLLWLQFEDRVACPSCGSRWRLDGHPTRGPGDCRLASFLVDDGPGFLRFRAT